LKTSFLEGLHHTFVRIVTVYLEKVEFKQINKKVKLNRNKALCVHVYFVFKIELLDFDLRASYDSGEISRDWLLA